MRVLPALLAVLLLAACDEAAPGAIDASDSPASRVAEAELAVGEAAVLAGVRVRFERVFGDSRCPTGAVCAWAGAADLEVVADGHALRLTLQPYRDPATFAVAVPGVAATVTAVDLSPYPDVAVDDPPPPVLTVRVVRAGGS